MKKAPTRIPAPTIPNPEFTADPQVREWVADRCLSHDELMACLPDEYGVNIRPEGEWICVIHPPHAEIDVPLNSIWFAKPTYRYRTFYFPSGPRGGKNEFRWPMLRAKITTPDGELWLLPGEYLKFRNGIAPLLPEVGRGLVMNWLGAGEPGDYADALFYMRARGISRQEAIATLLPHLEDQGFVYFTIDEEL